jgi:hypothetical protein
MLSLVVRKKTIGYKRLSATYDNARDLPWAVDPPALGMPLHIGLGPLSLLPTGQGSSFLEITEAFA